MDDREKKNRQLGFWASAGIHGVLILALFFVVAWRAPDPPLPEYGIELNFGLDDQGSGSVQPDQPVGEEGETAETATSEQSDNSDPTEIKEVTVPVVEKAVEQAISKTESPVVVKEIKKEPTPLKTDAADAAKEAPNVVAPIDAQKKGEAASQGDDAIKTGDKGSSEGKLDASALYGTPGGGGGGTGMNLQMSGWAWADKPSLPELPDNENGQVLFEIECDANGDIVGITTLQRTLSPRSEQMLKEVIRKNSLVRTSGGKIPERSKGRIAFVLKTN